MSNKNDVKIPLLGDKDGATAGDGGSDGDGGGGFIKQSPLIWP